MVFTKIRSSSSVHDLKPPTRLQEEATEPKGGTCDLQSLMDKSEMDS